MFILEAIDAAHGDAILVRYKGNAGFERIILVDGGPPSERTNTARPTFLTRNASFPA